MCDDDTLIVHLRSGDKGLVEDEFINVIQKLQSTYSKIVILCGIHHNSDRSHIFPSLDQSIDNLKKSLHKLNLNIKNVIIDTNEPDVHLCIMSKAKNLLLHKGGFSILGALLFTGNNLYITNLFYAKNSNFLQHVKSPILL
jgi:hypothetical protein